MFGLMIGNTALAEISFLPSNNSQTTTVFESDINGNKSAITGISLRKCDTDNRSAYIKISTKAIKLTETIFKDITGTETYNIGPDIKVLHGPLFFDCLNQLRFPPTHTHLTKRKSNQIM